MMKVGENRTVEVPSRPRNVRTGLILDAGEYALEASASWTDSGHPARSPEGFQSDSGILRATEWMRRTPDAEWFALIGQVGGGRPFVIGRSARPRIATAGELAAMRTMFG
jgi:hypothetical protein